MVFVLGHEGSRHKGTTHHEEQYLEDQEKINGDTHGVDHERCS
jgi:hypothetical protein